MGPPEPEDLGPGQVPFCDTRVDLSRQCKQSASVVARWRQMSCRSEGPCSGAEGSEVRLVRESKGETVIFIILDHLPK